VISYISNEGVRISRILAKVDDLSQNAKTPELRSDAARVRDAVSDAAGLPSDGPFSRPSATMIVMEDPDQAVRRGGGGGVVESFEISHRKIELFPENTGYDKNFLTGHTIPLPKPSAALRSELAPRLDKPGEFLLPFRHFTTAMHARRRLPVFAAINLDGKKMPDGAMPDRPGWSFDPRIDEAHQPDDTIFSDMLQRGHMAARPPTPLRPTAFFRLPPAATSFPSLAGRELPEPRWLVSKAPKACMVDAERDCSPSY
jgi:endonuclease G